MEMCYNGALAMPKNYVLMSSDEMTYLEGGAVNTAYMSASKAGSYLGALAASFTLMAAGFTTATVITGATGVGLVVGGLGTALYSFIASQYTSANVSAQKILANYGNVLCKVQEVTLFGVITDVTCTRVK